MAEPRNIRLRIIWPLLILIGAGAMWFANRSHTAQSNVKNEEVEQWVLEWVSGHLDGSDAPLPTVNDVLNRRLTESLRMLRHADRSDLTVQVRGGEDDAVRYASLMESGEVRCIIEVRLMEDGRFAISGMQSIDSVD